MTPRPRSSNNRIPIGTSLDRDLYHRVQVAAAEEGTKVNAIIEDLLTAWLAGRGKAAKKKGGA